MGRRALPGGRDRKSTRLNSSHTEIYTLSLHDALPICSQTPPPRPVAYLRLPGRYLPMVTPLDGPPRSSRWTRSEEHTSELQSHRDLHSFPTRRSSDLFSNAAASAGRVLKITGAISPNGDATGWAAALFQVDVQEAWSGPRLNATSVPHNT